MEDTLKLRMRGNTLSTLLSIVRCIQNKPRYFAEKLLKAMQCAETADQALIRIIVSRCEIDLKNIMNDFHKIKGKSLHECIDVSVNNIYWMIIYSNLCHFIACSTLICFI
ncbi:unnamed protein product [Schistosoma intercalatum]|nr:unnamed protein product [Schistosoma intercalatum]